MSRPGKASGLYIQGQKAHPGSSRPGHGGPAGGRERSKKRPRPDRSVWNKADDWDKLVADSTLSTSSVSGRRPYPRGLPSLARCASDAAARGFEAIWTADATLAQGDERAQSSNMRGFGRYWKYDWEVVPDHLKEGVRDAVFRMWGRMLSFDIVRVMSTPPHLYLPGDLLPALAEAKHMFGAQPQESAAARLYTSLTLTHAAKAPDAAIAKLIRSLPQLEAVNLKGCAMAGAQTIKAVLQLREVKQLNLKGTAVKEEHVKELLDAFGSTLDKFKIDNVLFPNGPDEVFVSYPYPKLAKLCLPGDIINAPSRDFRVRAHSLHHRLEHPTPRPAAPSAVLDWPKLESMFPALTHLYLPGLLLPPLAEINLTPHTLVKLSLGHGGGPPVPIEPLVKLIQRQTKSLKVLHLGHLLPVGSGMADFDWLGTVLKWCSRLEDFRLEMDPQGSRNTRCDQGMKRHAHLAYFETVQDAWKGPLKRVSLGNLPVQAFMFEPVEGDTGVTENAMPEAVKEGSAFSSLEQLDLAGCAIDDTAAFAGHLSRFHPNLRSLDLSGTSVTEEDVFTILDGCPKISRIDLTSCRGVNVRHRRNIFQAWQDARNPPKDLDSHDGDDDDERTTRTRKRPKRTRGG